MAFAVSSMLISNPGKKKKIHQSVCEATSESAKVTFMVCDEAMEEQLNLWIYEMVT